MTENETAGNEKMPDPEGYQERMSKSIPDKVTWTKWIRSSDYQYVLDYGCAEGKVLKRIAQKYPRKTYIGYDINANVIETAKKKFPGGFFSTDWDEAVKRCDPAQTVLMLTGVIHEVYSYLPKEEIDAFWQRVYGSGFRYIFVRDWLVSERWFGKPVPQGVQDLICKRAPETQLHEFSTHLGDHCGPLGTYDRLIHFLLKYKFTENWVHEIEEDYLSVSLEHFLNRIPDNYLQEYGQHYILPYIKAQIRKDFGYYPAFQTHYKAILRLR